MCRLLRSSHGNATASLLAEPRAATWRVTVALAVRQCLLVSMQLMLMAMSHRAVRHERLRRHRHVFVVRVSVLATSTAIVMGPIVGRAMPLLHTQRIGRTSPGSPPGQATQPASLHTALEGLPVPTEQTYGQVSEHLLAQGRRQHSVIFLRCCVSVVLSTTILPCL